MQERREAGPLNWQTMWRDVFRKAQDIATEVARQFLVSHVQSLHHPTASVSFVLGSAGGDLTTSDRLIVPISRGYRVQGMSIVADAAGSCAVDIRLVTP